MKQEDHLLSVIDGSRRGLAASFLRGILAVLAYVYVAGLRLFLLPYRLGIRRKTRLPCPVISVGNLTVGGTGKTPMTTRVCRLLQSRGLRVCVLNRGYRGANEHGAAIVSSERIELTPQEAGDEAHLLASLLPGVPVIVGKDRRITGKLAYERFHPDVIVLDDGMQFYQLHRELDLVLLDAQRPFDNGWTFPRGLLREPPSHLNRAGCIVITNSDKVEPDHVDALRRQVGVLAPGKPIFTSKLAPTRLQALDRSRVLPDTWLAGRSVALLSAIGNPGSFAAQVRMSGAEALHHAAFPDHHELTGGELQQVIEKACSVNAEAVIVTEKDAVKLPPIMRPIPFYSLAVEMVISDEARFEQILMGAGGR